MKNNKTSRVARYLRAIDNNKIDQYYDALSGRKKKDAKEKKKIIRDSKTDVPTRYYQYIRSAKRLKRKFTLSLSDFSDIILQSCFYCGTLPDPLNGIDRVDNSKGYIQNNCVSCCSACNQMKYNYSQDFFLNHICKVYNYQKNKLSSETISN